MFGGDAIPILLLARPVDLLLYIVYMTVIAVVSGHWRGVVISCLWREREREDDDNKWCWCRTFQPRTSLVYDTAAACMPWLCAVYIWSLHSNSSGPSPGV